MATRSAPAKKAPAQKRAAKTLTATPPQKMPATPAAKATAAPVITLKAIFEDLGATHALPKQQAQGLLASLTMHLRQGDRIRMSGLGILEVKTRAARMGRNPATGESIQIKASKKVAFRPAKELKEAL